MEAASWGRLRVEAPLALPPPSLVLASDDYYDPVVRRRSLAGFAPVGNTGFVVIVSSAHDDILSLEVAFGWRLITWAALAASTGALLMLLAARCSRRQIGP